MGGRAGGARADGRLRGALGRACAGPVSPSCRRSACAHLIDRQRASRRRVAAAPRAICGCPADRATGLAALLLDLLTRVALEQVLGEVVYRCSARCCSSVHSHSPRTSSGAAPSSIRTWQGRRCGRVRCERGVPGTCARARGISPTRGENHQPHWTVSASGQNRRWRQRPRQSRRCGRRSRRNAARRPRPGRAARRRRASVWSKALAVAVIDLEVRASPRRAARRLLGIQNPGIPTPPPPPVAAAAAAASLAAFVSSSSRACRFSAASAFSAASFAASACTASAGASAAYSC